MMQAWSTALCPNRKARWLIFRVYGSSTDGCLGIVTQNSWPLKVGFLTPQRNALKKKNWRNDIYFVTLRALYKYFIIIGHGQG